MIHTFFALTGSLIPTLEPMNNQNKDSIESYRFVEIKAVYRPQTPVLSFQCSSLNWVGRSRSFTFNPNFRYRANSSRSRSVRLNSDKAKIFLSTKAAISWNLVVIFPWDIDEFLGNCIIAILLKVRRSFIISANSGICLWLSVITWWPFNRTISSPLLTTSLADSVTSYSSLSGLSLYLCRNRLMLLSIWKKSVVYRVPWMSSSRNGIAILRGLKLSLPYLGASLPPHVGDKYPI